MQKNLKVYIASDHGGFLLKEEIVKHLKGKGVEVVDMGNSKYDKEDDYTEFVIPLAEKVALRQTSTYAKASEDKQDKQYFGIVLGRSGNGEQIAANKIKGIRAILACNEKMARVGREHNDANILSLGADYVSTEEAKLIVDAFINTSFSGEERHTRRIEAIKQVEQKNK
jgi:ribose 5-phosphate isomerase B